VESYSDRSGRLHFDLGYDPEKYPYQRLDVGYTPEKHYPSWIPNSLKMWRLQKQVRRHLESVDDAVNLFKNLPASPERDVSISDDVQSRLDNGEVIGVLVDHTESGDLRDVGLAVGTLILAMGDFSNRQRTVLTTGKNMSRQGLKLNKHWWQKKQPMITVADEISKGMGVLWVWPNSLNANSLKNIPERGRRIVKLAGGRALEELSDKGGVLVGTVPSGTANTVWPKKVGKADSVRPKVATETYSELAKMDALLPVATYQGRIQPGLVHEIGSSLSSKAENRTDRIAQVEVALRELAQRNSNLMGVNVRYTKYNGVIGIVSPETKAPKLALVA